MKQANKNISKLSLPQDLPPRSSCYWKCMRLQRSSLLLTNVWVLERLNVTFVGFWNAAHTDYTENHKPLREITHKHLFAHMHKHRTAKKKKSFLAFTEKHKGWRSMSQLWQMTREFHHPNKHLLIQVPEDKQTCISLALINTLHQPGSWQVLATWTASKHFSGDITDVFWEMYALRSQYEILMDTAMHQC